MKLKVETYFNYLINALYLIEVKLLLLLFAF